MPHTWFRRIRFHALLLALAVMTPLFVGCRAEAPQPTPLAPIPTLLADNSETRIEMTPGSGERLYNFSSRRLKLGSHTPGFAFAAELRSADGQTVAQFTHLLQDIQMTLADGSYQLSVSPGDQRQSGEVSLGLGSAVIAPETLDGTAYHAANCAAANTANADAVVRTAPTEQHAVLGLLPPQGLLAAIGRTDNGWYSVSFGERLGWVSSSVVTPEGDCASLPVVRNPTIPNAPADAPAFLLQADRDGSGSFSDVISAPGGDTIDTIWVQVINLDTRPPNNYREFVLSLDCDGTGIDAVRWGSAYAPSLQCGQSVVVPFLSGTAQQPFTVSLPTGSHQSYVRYTLSAQPAAVVG